MNTILMISLQEYFTKSAGPVRRVMLTYNQNGTSRGIASIIFMRADTAAKAAKDLNGLLVDGRPMKVGLRRISLALGNTDQPNRSRLSSTPPRLPPFPPLSLSTSVLCK